jgi:hypothetical protein
MRHDSDFSFVDQFPAILKCKFVRHRIFFLSPANCAGERAKLLLKEEATFSRALQLRTQSGVSVGEVFSFLSGLYFRGKLAYAQTFATPPLRLPGVLVITPTRGLLCPDEPVTIELLREFAQVDIEARDPRYLGPFRKDAQRLAAQVGKQCEIVLLGSIATGKYYEVLAECFGDRLLFPAEFVGRGDMSRGGLLLRCVAARRELCYVTFSESQRRGPRPPRLRPIARRVTPASS